MKRQFTATANAHGFGEYVDNGYKIPDETHKTYKKYIKASNHIYNALEYSCCSGTAITIIEKYRKEREGIKAWKKLVS